MEMKQLEYFCSIVEAGTISGAAKALHMTQPPLSYQMKMLEDELEVQLFLRGTKKITLTEAGVALYERAESLLKMADITKREVFRIGTAATIHIGITPSSVSMMAEYLARFAQKFPAIHFDIHEGSTFALREQLENQVVDITTLRTPLIIKGYETKSLAKEKLLIMALPAHEIVQQDPQKLTLKTLSQYKIILSRRYRRYVLSAFEEKGIFCDIYCECQDARTALTLAENGLGVAVLPASMQKLTSRVVCREIIDADLTTEILLAWRKERLPAEVQEFLAIW
mgnify:CR=1 FL=1